MKLQPEWKKNANWSELQRERQTKCVCLSSKFLFLRSIIFTLIMNICLNCSYYPPINSLSKILLIKDIFLASEGKWCSLRVFDIIEIWIPDSRRLWPFLILFPIVIHATLKNKVTFQKQTSKQKPGNMTLSLYIDSLLLTKTLSSLLAKSSLTSLSLLGFHLFRYIISSRNCTLISCISWWYY